MSTTRERIANVGIVCAVIPVAIPLAVLWIGATMCGEVILPVMCAGEYIVHGTTNGCFMRIEKMLDLPRTGCLFVESKLLYGSHATGEYGRSSINLQ
jgi:hypothetical protein